jgi:YaiO family outer membrane protein
MKKTMLFICCAASFAAQAQQTPAEPPPERGSIQLGVSRSNLTGGNEDWNDVFARGNLNLGEQVGVLNWEASQQKHFNETGQTASLSLTRDFGPDWYGMVGAGAGRSASFLPVHRFDVAVYRKWLQDRQLVTGLQYTQSKSGDRLYRDRAWQLSASYYFSFPLTAELGARSNTSNPGSIRANRYYAAATYGENKKYYASLRYDAGREGYLPQGSNVSAVDFKSDVVTLTWRQWLTRQWGYELSAEQYHNPFYDRRGLSASMFYDF